MADHSTTALYAGAGFVHEAYETGMLHAQNMMELAEQLTEQIVEDAEIYSCLIFKRKSTVGVLCRKE
jgi:hypothetical protein